MHHGRVSEEPQGEAERKRAAARRRRIAEIFGDVLPQTTGDERDPGEPDPAREESAREAWYRQNRPPHHG